MEVKLCFVNNFFFLGKINFLIGKILVVRVVIFFLYIGEVEIIYEIVKDILEVVDYF